MNDVKLIQPSHPSIQSNTSPSNNKERKGRRWCYYRLTPWEFDTSCSDFERTQNLSLLSLSIRLYIKSNHLFNLHAEVFSSIPSLSHSHHWAIPVLPNSPNPHIFPFVNYNYVNLFYFIFMFFNALSDHVCI